MKTADLTIIYRALLSLNDQVLKLAREIIEREIDKRIEARKITDEEIEMMM